MTAVDQPDWTSNVFQADTPDTLYSGTQTGQDEYTFGPYDVSQFSSLDVSLAVATAAGVNQPVIVTVDHLIGTAIVAQDTFGCWSVPSGTGANQGVSARIPLKGTSITVAIKTTTSDNTINLAIISSRRAVPTFDARNGALVTAGAVLSVANGAVGASSIADYYCGPATGVLSIYFSYSNTTDVSLVISGRTDPINITFDHPLVVAQPASGVSYSRDGVQCAGLPLHVQVVNNGTATANFSLTIVGGI